LRVVAFSVLMMVSIAATTAPAGAIGSPPSSFSSGYEPSSTVASEPRIAGTSQLGLCHFVNQVTSLTATRSRYPNKMTFSFPHVVRSTNVTAVRAAAKALCALPVMPSGVYNCPLDVEVHYRLKFVVGEAVSSYYTRFVVIDPWGCETVTGLGAGRTATVRLWPVLGAALGLRHATGVTFAGRLDS
jgi:hypothetical protein